MSKLQLFNAYLTERLTAAAAEISVAVERTITDYQEENERLRRLLDLLTKPKFHRAGLYCVNGRANQVWHHNILNKAHCLGKLTLASPNDAY